MSFLKNWATKANDNTDIQFKWVNDDDSVETSSFPTIGKLGQAIDNKVQWADTQINNLISNAHSSVCFKVEGDRKHFYPVIINTSLLPFRFFIARDSVHWDSTWYGKCIIHIEGVTTHWGHGANYTRVITNNHSKTRYLSRAYEEFETGWIVLYLRGNTTYRFISDWGYAKLGDYSTKNKKWQRDNSGGGDAGWIEFRPVDDGTDTTYQDKFKGNWVMDLTKGGCQMVSRSTSGRIIDTENV